MKIVMGVFMPLLDVFSVSKKHAAMEDTWGYFYPEPGTKWYGEITIAHGDYGDLIIVKTDFPGLDCSPQRHAIETTVLDMFDTEPGIYTIKCGIWFFRTCHNMYKGEPIGKIIYPKIEQIL